MTELATESSVTRSERPSPAAPPTATDLLSPPGSGTDASDTLLRQIMPLAGLAIWEAWSGSLELIELNPGTGADTPFQLDPAQRQPGTSWTESVYPPDREKLDAFLAGAESTRATRSVDYRLIVGDGELLWVRHWLLSSATTATGRRRLRGLVMAIPESKHLEWECLRVSERECNRIGQELHDDLCQVLAGVTFMMRVIGQRAAKPGADLTIELSELNAELVGAMNRVRSMAHGLFPTQLNHRTLSDALHEFARQTKTRFPIEFALQLPRNLAPHSPEQIIHIYRIAQEAVNNSMRHADATAIRLAVAPDGANLQMTVEDNGPGFPTTGARPEGIGMHVMQYRARMLGGEVRFRNGSPHGAVVALTYPRSAAAPDCVPGSSPSE